MGKLFAFSYTLADLVTGFMGKVSVDGGSSAAARVDGVSSVCTCLFYYPFDRGRDFLKHNMR